VIVAVSCIGVSGKDIVSSGCAAGGEAAQGMSVERVDAKSTAAHRPLATPSRNDAEPRRNGIFAPDDSPTRGSAPRALPI